MNDRPIPVVLFAYARTRHLQRTLDCLRRDEIPLLYVFSDGPRGVHDVDGVAQAREIVRAIDWCDVRITERPTNWGLGRSVIAGVTEVLQRHESVLVFEDDLVCVPGTYPYLAAALRHYHDDPRVMSVSGWTHPRLTPPDVGDLPFFDGRAESWSWGTWARAWEGMDRTAWTLLRECRKRGIDVYRYGADLPDLAMLERRLNIWLVRWAYLHLLHGGLCLRPPWSLVDNEGFDATATFSSGESRWANPGLRPAPLLPTRWPQAVEHPGCAALWRAGRGERQPLARRLWKRGRIWFHYTAAGRLARAVLRPHSP